MNTKIDTRVILKADDDPLFYTIPGFPGYEATKNGYIRSFKNMRDQYPYGYIIRCCDKANTKFKITNRNNQLVSISYAEILSLIESQTGHPYYETPWNVSRNKRMGIHQGEETPGKVIRNPKPVRKNNEAVYLSDLFAKDSYLNSWSYSEDD
jgi:hypothetical protein